MSIPTVSNISCPFCGSLEIYVYPKNDDDIVAYCENCNAEGPPKSNEFDAVKAWESRKSTIRLPGTIGYHDVEKYYLDEPEDTP